MKLIIPIASLAILASAAPTLTARATSDDRAAVDVTDTRLLAQPATDGKQIAFIYAGDLWSARLDGTDVRRLTTADGDERNPTFSPDGNLITFTGNYDGNADVYVIPALGGAPRASRGTRRGDRAGVHADGKQVLFTSARNAVTGSLVQLFTVPIEGGVETQLPIPQRIPGHVFARRAPHRLQPVLTPVPPVETLPRRARLANLALRFGESRHREDSAARRRGPMTSTPCGWVPRSTSAPTAPASSTSSPTTRRQG